MKEKIYIVFLLILFFLIPSFLYAQSTIDKEIDAKEIINKLSAGKDIYYENVVIKGDLNFTYVDTYHLTDFVEGDGYNLYKSFTIYIDNSIHFINCKFEGRIITYRKEVTDNRYIDCYKIVFENEISFVNTEFKEQINFYDTIFMGKVNFYKSVFNKEVIVNLASFRDSAVLGAIYKKYTDFSEVLFEASCDFTNSKFYGKVNFASSVFVSITTFTSSTFYGEADFSWANFMDKVYFFEVAFKKFVSFSNVCFSMGPPVFELTVFESGVLFEKVTYGPID